MICLKKEVRECNRRNLSNRLYICRVQCQQEQLAEGQQAVLFCDSEGNLTTAVVESAVLGNAQGALDRLRREGKKGAAVCIEIAPGLSATFAVEVNAEQAEALVQIHQLAYVGAIAKDRPKIPDRLTECVAEIIKLGEARVEELRERYEKVTHSRLPAVTPELEHELPGRFDTVARYNEPNAAIVLKRLQPNKQTRPGMQRVLVLDYQGLFRIVRIPVEALDEAERELEQLRKTHHTSGVIALATNEEGFLMGAMGITEEEKEALDIVEWYFETTGCSMNDIPTPVKMILARAKVAHSARNSQDEGL